MSKEDIVISTISASLSSIALGLVYLVLKSPEKKKAQSVDKKDLLKFLKQKKMQKINKLEKIREESKNKRLQYFPNDPANYHLVLNEYQQKEESALKENELQISNNPQQVELNLSMLLHYQSIDISFIQCLQFQITCLEESQLPTVQITQDKTVEMLNFRCTSSRDLLNAVGHVNDHKAKSLIAQFFVQDDMEKKFPEYTYGQMEY